MLLRNPIERAYSHWQMEVNRDADDVSFFEAITNESTRCRQALPSQHRTYSYIDRGFYSEQLRRIWRYYPRKNVLNSSAKTVMSNVCNHLSIEELPGNSWLSEIVFAGNYREKMSDEAKQLLMELFEFEIKQLERILGWDLSHWLD